MRDAPYAAVPGIRAGGPARAAQVQHPGDGRPEKASFTAFLGQDHFEEWKSRMAKSYRRILALHG